MLSDLLLVTGIAVHAFAAPTTVRVSFVEALAPRDTTSSERFQKDYDLAINIGRHRIENRLRSCGYSLETETVFYDASDPLQARERGLELERKGAWLIVGPRRSNHYVLLAQGAKSTPTISPMAASSEIEALGAMHISLSPSSKEMGRAAATETKARLGNTKNRSYVSVVSRDCTSCLDFELAFTKAAKTLGLKQTHRIEITGDAPDTTELEAAIKSSAPTFVLLPNYSKVSSIVMLRVAKLSRNVFFVGSDGWGDANFGFIHQSEGAAVAQGFSVRGFPPMENGLKRFRLGRDVLAKRDTLPKGGPALGILKSLDGIAELLCGSGAKTREAFKKQFQRDGNRLFAAPWGINLYEIKNGELSFSYPLRGVAKNEN